MNQTPKFKTLWIPWIKENNGKCISYENNTVLCQIKFSINEAKAGMKKFSNKLSTKYIYDSPRKSGTILDRTLDAEWFQRSKLLKQYFVTFN